LRASGLRIRPPPNRSLRAADHKRRRGRRSSPRDWCAPDFHTGPPDPRPVSRKRGPKQDGFRTGRPAILASTTTERVSGVAMRDCRFSPVPAQYDQICDALLRSSMAPDRPGSGTPSKTGRRTGPSRGVTMSPAGPQERRSWARRAGVSPAKRRTSRAKCG
jgi:hypothetical protein